jgi:hypothetical protein
LAAAATTRPGSPRPPAHCAPFRFSLALSHRRRAHLSDDRRVAATVPAATGGLERPSRRSALAADARAHARRSGQFRVRVVDMTDQTHMPGVRGTHRRRRHLL